MKLYTNKRYNTIALYAILVIAVNVLIVVAIFKFGTILRILSALVGVLMPLIWGLVIAFLMNPIMVRLEKLFNKKIIKNPSRKNRCAVCLLPFLRSFFSGSLQEL